MKHILITLGYNIVAIPLTEESAKLLPILASAKIVDSNGYGDERKLVPTTNSVQIEFTDKVVASDEVSVLKAKLEIAEKQSSDYAKYWENTRKEKDELTKKLNERSCNFPKTEEI